MAGLGLALVAVAIAGCAGSTRLAGAAQARLQPASAVGGPNVLPAAGSQLAVVAAVIHNPSHVEVTSVPVGTRVHVRATIAGAFGTPTGTVTSRVYSGGSCSGFIQGESNPATLSGGVADITGFTWTSNTTGQASFVVHYSGNATYAGRDGFCTAVTFTRILPSAVTLHVHNPSHATVVEVPLGTSVHPQASVAGSLGVPTGSVRVSWWQDGNCFGTPTFVFNPQTLVNGAIDMTNLVQPSNNLGAYSYRAEYLGNSTYQPRTGACVEYDVIKATPTINVSIHDPGHEPTAEVAVGTLVHPAVSLSGPLGTPTGTVQIKRYAGALCTDLQNTVSHSAQATIDPAATPFSYDQPGTWSWRISYLGDARYTAKDSVCMKVHWKAQPVITSFVHDDGHLPVSTVAPGTAVHLSVTAISTFGLPTPTGKVAIYFYSNGSCPGAGGLNQGTGTLSGGALDASTFSVAPTTPGTYQLVAVYQGDSSYYITIGPCVPFTVAIPATPKPTPTPTKAPTPPPTQAPTPVPTTSAAPTLAPGATPTAIPTGTAPGVSPEPGASATSAASDSPGPSPEPGATGEPGATTADGETAGPGGIGSPEPTAGPSTPAGDAGSGFPVLLVVVAILVLGGIGFAFGNRRRRPS